jgi:hypothetical protein
MPVSAVPPSFMDETTEAMPEVRKWAKWGVS